MKPFQERVIEEKAQLDERIIKLEAFLASSMCTQLPADEVRRMMAQARAMATYSSILGERIDHFTAT